MKMIAPLWNYVEDEIGVKFFSTEKINLENENTQLIDKTTAVTFKFNELVDFWNKGNFNQLITGNNCAAIMLLDARINTSKQPTTILGMRLMSETLKDSLNIFAFSNLGLK